MTHEKLQKIAALTEINNHTKALLWIVSEYDYLKPYALILEGIEKIHQREGHLPYRLYQARHLIADEMLNEILCREGTEIHREIYQVL